MKYLKQYSEKCNESIRDFLKPKPIQDILSNIGNLSDEDKFSKSCEFGITPIVKDLIDNGFDPSYMKNYGLRIASNNGHLDIVKLLLNDKRVDPSAFNNCALIWSISNGHLDVVKELLKHKRVDPSDGNNCTLTISLERGYLDILKQILKDERVTSKLSKYQVEKYQKQIREMR